MPNLIRNCIALTVIFIFLALQVESQIEISANTTEGCTPLPVSISVTSPSNISSYLWEITLPDNSVVTAASSSYFANLSIPGGYDITLTINGTTTQTWDNYIVVHDIPVADFEVNLTTGCYPLCVEFTDNSTATDGAIVGWNWDFGDGASGNLSQITECYQNPGIYSPFLSITDENGCFSDISMPALINVSDQFPTSTFTPSSLLDCNAPVPINFVNSSFGTSSLTSSWSFGNGDSLQAGAEDISYTFDQIGVYNVCLEVTDDIGCENTSCQEITIFDPPDAEFSLSDDLICLGNEITFQNETFYPPLTFQWDFDGDGTVDSNQENPSYSYSSEGNYQPSLTVIYSDNCEDTQLLDLEVLPAFTVDFEADTLIACSVPFEVNFTNTTTGSSDVDYEWFIDGLSVGNTADLTYTFTQMGSFSITLVGTNSAGCESTVTESNYINLAFPTVSYSIPEFLCYGEVFEVSNLNINSIDSITTWMWDFEGDGVIDSYDQNPTYIIDEGGEYTTTLTFVTANGCVPEQPITEDISLTGIIEANFTISDTVSCAGNPVELCIEGMTEGMEGAIYDNSPLTQLLYDYLDTCGYYYFTDTGLVDVTMILSLGNCSTETVFTDIIDISGPIVHFNYTHDCDDLLTYSFFDNSIEGDNYIWDFDDGSPLVYDEINPVHTFPDFGVYDVTLFISNDSIGCSDARYQRITIVEPNAELFFSQTTGCPPLEVEINGGESPFSYYFVDYGNGTTLEAEFTGSLYEVTFTEDGISDYYETSSLNYIWHTITYNEIGNYSIFSTITDGIGCVDSVTYDNLIEINTNPDFATFGINVIEDCDSVVLEFIPDLLGLLNPVWSFNNGDSDTISSPTVVYQEPYPPNISATFSADDSLGCSSTVSQNFDIDFPTNPLFTITTSPHCQGGVAEIESQSSGNITAYSWDFGDPNSGDDNYSSEENPTHVYNDNGSYEICLTTENSTGCQSTYCIPNAVTIENPEADFSYTSEVTNCNYGVTFVNTTEGNVTCSDWNFGDQQSGIGESVYHIYAIGVYDVSLVVCNEYGCVDTAMIEDILNFGSTVGPFTMDLDVTPCAPFTVSLEAFNIDDNSFTYYWDFTDGNGDPGDNTVTTHDYIIPGTYCPTLIMTDANGCSVLIDCPEPFTVDLFEVETSEVSSICFGDSLLFTVTGGESYSWDNTDDITTVDTNNYLLHPSDTTTFLLTGYLDDCVTTEEIIVPVNPLPEVTLEEPSEICFQTEVFELTGGIPNSTQGVYFVNENEETEFDPSWDANQWYEIVYQYTDENNCVNTAQTEIFILPLPEVTLDEFETYCNDFGTIELTGGSPFGGQYLDANLDSISSISSFDNLGENTITYIFSDENNCVNTATQSLVVVPNPIVQIEWGAACADSYMMVTNLSSISSGTIDSTTWYFDNEFLSNNNEIDSIALFDPGDYVLELALVSDFGCSADSSIDIHVSVNPVAEFIAAEGCQGEELFFENTSTFQEGAMNNSEWLVDGELIADSENLTHAFDDWGIFLVQLNIQDENQCTDNAVAEIEVYSTPLIDFELANNCLGEISTFVNQSGVQFTNPPTEIESFFWDFGDGNSSSEENTVANMYVLPGIYPVSLTAVTDHDCESSLTQEIVIYPLPEINIQLSDSSICERDKLTLTADVSVASPYTIDQINWNLNDSIFGNEFQIDFFISSTNNIHVQLGATTNVGCYSSYWTNELVSIHPVPEANFSFAPEVISILNPTVNFFDFSEGAVSWHWDFGDASSSGWENPSHTYQSFGEYTVTQYVSSPFGCLDSISVTLDVEQDIGVWVPNAFTPNSDGINEVFRPIFFGFDIADYTLEIYDSWGVKIFETHDSSTPWLGNYREGDYYVKDGIYNWQMKFKRRGESNMRLKRGFVTVLR